MQIIPKNKLKLDETLDNEKMKPSDFMKNHILTPDAVEVK